MMQTIFLDLETFFSTEYSLRRMTPVEYALDPRFECLGCAFIINNGEPFWIDGPDLPEFFKGIDWSQTFAVSHNALFDFAVLKWRYGIVPGLIGDTIAMARAWLRYKTERLDLGTLAAHIGEAKGSAIKDMKNVSYAQLRASPWLYPAAVEYAKNDVHICWSLFTEMMTDGFPIDQLELIDMQAKMCVQPKFVFDRQVLAEHLQAVQSEKAQLLAATDLGNRDDLMSNEKFAALLMAEGVDPPMKTSPATGELTWDFSKQSKAFMDLQEHMSIRVQALMAARLGLKTTIEETRTQTFLRIAELDWQGNEIPCSAPVPLKFSGAHTHRYSGDWKLNMQNLKRGGRLRHALRAPPGFSVVSVDAEQIEARIAATLAGQWDLVDQFEQKRDVYADFAKEIFGYPVNKVEHPRERYIGKTAVLQLGYGAGWVSFQTQVRTNSNREVLIDDEEAEKVVKLYRRKNSAIADCWQTLDEMIPHMKEGEHFNYGAFTIEGSTVWLPNGMKLEYEGLHRANKYGRLQWFYQYGNREKVLYGAKLFENFVQSLAFVIIMETARRVKRATHNVLIPAHQVHDELIYVVPTEVAQNVVNIVKHEMMQRPEYMPLLPLSAAGGFGPSYGEVKE